MPMVNLGHMVKPFEHRSSLTSAFSKSTWEPTRDDELIIIYFFNIQPKRQDTHQTTQVRQENKSSEP